MIRHLAGADFRVMTWANGKGSTVEMLRIDGPGGALRLRLSRASVVEDGPFSLFPGIERNLTVISGPGFSLAGTGVDLRCAPFVPVGFAGDLPVRATDVAAASDDFNVMWARDLPAPRVTVVAPDAAGAIAPPPGGWIALYDPQTAALTLADEPASVPAGAGLGLLVAISGLAFPG